MGGSIAPDGLLAIAQASVTFPVNPPLGEMVTVEVALAPGDAMLIAVPLIAKFGVWVGVVTVIATLVD